MRRTLNIKFLLCLMACLLVASGGMALAHHLQYRRIPLALLTQAQRAEDEKDYRRTDDYLTRYLAFEPADVEQKARLVRLLTDPKNPTIKQQSARAFFLLQDVLSSDGDRHDLRRLFVPLAIELNHLQAAEDQLKRLPEDAETSNLWGRFYEAKHLTVEAIEHYRESLGRDASNVQAATHFARLLRSRRWDQLAAAESSRKRQADAEEADKVLDELVRANPESWQARVARWNYKRAHWLRPRKGEAWSSFQQLVFDILTVDAARDVTRALQLREGEPDVRLAAAEAAQLQGDLVGVRAHLDKARQLHRKEPRVYKSYAGLELLVEEQARTVEAKAQGDAEKLRAKTDREQARARAIAWLRQGALELTQNAQFELQWAHASLLLDTGTKKELDEAEKLIAKIRTTNITPGGAAFLQGRLMSGRQQWAEAARLLESSRLALESSFELANQIDLMLGRCYDELNQPNQQYDTYKRLVKRNPDSIAARLGLATAARALGKLDEALELLGNTMQTPEVPRAVWSDYLRLGIVKARQSNSKADWTMVEESIDDALKRKLTDDVEAAIFRAECHVARNENERAQLILEQARDKNPNRVEAWAALATLAEKVKDPDRALRLLDEAASTMKKPADQVELRLARANHWVQRQSPEARTQLAKLSRAAEQDLEKLEPRERNRLLGGLAEASSRAGNSEEAVRLWRRLGEQDEYRADLRLRLMLFDLAMQEEQEDEMKRVLKEVKTLEGEDGTFARHAEALRLIWRVRKNKVPSNQKRETLAEATRLLNQVIAARPSWSAAQMARAEIENLRGNPDEAVACYKKARQSDRGPTVLRQLVEALRKQGKIAEAEQLLSTLRPEELVRADLERAFIGFRLRGAGHTDQVIDEAYKTIRTDSRDYRDHLWLGRVLASSGRKKDEAEAEKALFKAKELNSREPETWVALIHFLATRGRQQEAQQLLGVAEASIAKDRVPLAMAQCYSLLGKPEEAKRFYQKALEARPTDGTVLSEFASFCMQRNALADAEPLLRRLVKDDVKRTPEETEWAHGRLAVVLAATGDFARFKEALPHVGLKLTASGELLADDSLIHSESLYLKRAAARVLATTNIWKTRDAAIERLEELDARQALTADDRFLLSRLYENKGDWSKARTQLSQLALSKDCQVDHLASYVRGLLTRKELTQAERGLARLEAFHKASPFPAGNALLVELRARLHEAKGEGKQAIDLLQQRVSQKDTNPQEVLLLVSSLGRQKRFDEAINCLEQVWKSCPPEMAGGTSIALLRSEKTTQAQREKVAALLKAAVEKDPKNVTLKVQRGDVLDLLGNYQEAEKEYREALALEKDNTLALNNLAWLLALRAGKGEEGLVLIGRALEKSGPVAEVLDTRGVIYYTLGRGKEALADLQDALKEASSPTRCFHLAQVYLLLDQRREASRILRQAKDLGLQAAQLHPVEQVAYRKVTAELNDR